MRLANIGSGMAALCAVHCLALPVLAGSSAFGSAALLEHPAIELGMLAFTGLIGYGTLGVSFRHHRSVLPLALLTLGLAGLVLGHETFSGHLATVSTLGGAATVVGAQWSNRRLSGGGCAAVCCESETNPGLAEALRSPTS